MLIGLHINEYGPIGRFACRFGALWCIATMMHKGWHRGIAAVMHNGWHEGWQPTSHINWSTAGRCCIEQFIWTSLVALELPCELTIPILECLSHAGARLVQHGAAD